MKNGSLVSATNSDANWTPLHWATYRGDKIDLKQSRSQMKSKWFHILGQDEIAEQLIVNGSSVSAKDSYGNIPLHWAAYQGNEIESKWQCKKIVSLFAMCVSWIIFRFWKDLLPELGPVKEGPLNTTLVLHFDAVIKIILQSN